jgi:hypothetical protein
VTHPYQSRTRNRDRSLAPQTNAPTPVTWIVAALFALILIVAFVMPIAQHMMERGQ